MYASKSLYENMDLIDPSFPVLFHFNVLTKNNRDLFRNHWHKTIEFLYFIKGEGIVKCNTKRINVSPGTLVVVNSNELHQGFAVSDTLKYYCIIADNTLFSSSYPGACETKYINPIYSNHILFNNLIDNDKDINNLFELIIDEYRQKETGFELSVKSSLYRILVLLLRHYSNHVMTPSQYESRFKKLDKLNNILVYIEKHYKEDLSIDFLAKTANLSKYYFCHLFKEITGKSPGSYINEVRVNKAAGLLCNTEMNITEISSACGFNDSNYFSRLFKKYMKYSPLHYVKKPDL